MLLCLSFLGGRTAKKLFVLQIGVWGTTDLGTISISAVLSYDALIGFDYGRGSCFFFVCETNVSTFQNTFVRVSASIHTLYLQ